MAQELRQIVRIINVDIPGQKQLALALAKVKGIGPRFANGICNIAKLEKTRKLGSLNQQEVEQIEDIIKGLKQTLGSRGPLFYGLKRIIGQVTKMDHLEQPLATT